MQIYKPSHFRIEELVDRKTFNDRGEKAWQLLDDRALFVLQLLRKRYGPITVNNWLWGGDRQWSGLRTKECNIGATYSQHRFGRAFDCLIKNATAEEVRKDMLDFWPRQMYNFPITMEDDVSWFHFDTRQQENPVNIFKP
jgi:hypothetical protein